ncbi:MAG: glycosyltransferase family 39 protein [Bryobacteraceae bacterium]|nr:glycosyltransferase family 39 protein [Bryobacteraceae bacterium]
MAILLPAGWLAYQHQGLPHFGLIHDDSVYFSSARSLSRGEYRIENLPSTPYQTRYPPLYPLYLAIAWLIRPALPESLSIALFLQLAFLPLLFWLLWKVFERAGIPEKRRLLLLGVIACNPYVLYMSVTLLSELPFLCLVLAALLLSERSPGSGSIRWAALAGVLAGLAFLTRTAGLVLLFTTPAYLLLRRDRRGAAVFACVLVPFLAGWSLWTRAHMTAATDIVSLYYANYTAYYWLTFESGKNLPLMLWRNADEWLSALGALVAPKIYPSFFLKIFSQTIAVGGLIGLIRLLRSGVELRNYSLFALATSAMLWIWNFPPNERFVFPMLPLFFAGLLAEADHFAAMLRKARSHRDPAQRALARGMQFGSAALAAASFALQFFVIAFAWPAETAEVRALNRDRDMAWEWLRENTPATAGVAGFADPLLHLATGHKAVSMRIPPIYWYRSDTPGQQRLFEEISRFARAQGLSYVYYSEADFSRDFADLDRAAIEKAWAQDPDLELIYQFGRSRIYRVREGSKSAISLPRGP